MSDLGLGWMKMVNVSVLRGIDSTRLEEWYGKVMELDFSFHHREEVWWLLATTPSLVEIRNEDGELTGWKAGEISVLEEGVVGDRGWIYQYPVSTWKDWWNEMGGSAMRKSIHAQIVMFKAKCLTNRLVLKWDCSVVQAQLMEEQSWKVVFGDHCLNGHSYHSFQGVSVTCTNQISRTTKRWMEGGIAEVGQLVNLDMTSGASQGRKVKIGVCEEVTKVPCGMMSEELVMADVALFDGTLDPDVWFMVAKLVLKNHIMTRKELEAAYMGGKKFRKMGIRKQVEWKPEDLLNEDGTTNVKMSNELQHGNGLDMTVDGTHATTEVRKALGEHGYMGRLRSKQSKMRALSDGSLKGVRVNGMRTEQPKDYSTDGWFAMWVDGKRLDAALSTQDALRELMMVGEIPDWSDAAELAVECFSSEMEELFELTLDTRYCDTMEQMAANLPDSPKKVLLLFALCMALRNQCNQIKKAKGLPMKRAFRVDLTGNDRVEIRLWKKMKTEDLPVVKGKRPTGELGSKLWDALLAEVNKVA